MAIETSKGVQTELQVESREEQLSRLLALEVEIKQVESRVEEKKFELDGVKSELKLIVKEKDALVETLNGGQITLTVNVEGAEDAQDPELDDPDYPSEEELDEADKSAEEELEE